MRTIKRKVDSFEITHPNDPDIVVCIKRLNKLESMDFIFELGPKADFTPATVGSLFHRSVLWVTGLKDEDGQKIQWDGDASIFFEDALEVEEEGKKSPFWQYLLNKTQELAVKDPKAQG